MYWVENVMIMAWHDTITAAALLEAHAAAEPQRKRYPTGMSYVHIGRVQLALLDSEARQAFIKVVTDLSGYIAVVAVVTQASGFWASTLRSIVTAIAVASPKLIELQIHERAEELLPWLPERHEQLTGVCLDRANLRNILAEAERSV